MRGEGGERGHVGGRSMAQDAHVRLLSWPGCSAARVRRPTSSVRHRVCPTTLAAAYDPCRRNGLRDPEDQFDSDGREALVALMRRDVGEIGWWVRHVRADAGGDRRGVLDHAYALGRRGL
ncbi:hypothetical protein ASH01_17235 [Terrabacter sp. Soil811]|nr:hypothetical protein ASH01_17235 [Terrabacter sp. Soil811]